VGARIEEAAARLDAFRDHAILSDDEGTHMDLATRTGLMRELYTSLHPLLIRRHSNARGR
jgi:hypothetical protein